MDSSIILEKEVTFYLDGGWQLSGRVKKFEEKKIIIESDGVLSIIMRDKVSCMSVISDSTDKPAGREYPSSERPVGPTSGGSFPMNGISYEDSTLTIPMSLYGGVEDPDDFSISFSKENDGKISFQLGDNEDDS